MVFPRLPGTCARKPAITQSYVPSVQMHPRICSGASSCLMDAPRVYSHLLDGSDDVTDTTRTCMHTRRT
jgi:hypothetical protein